MMMFLLLTQKILIMKKHKMKMTVFQHQLLHQLQRALEPLGRLQRQPADEIHIHRGEAGLPKPGHRPPQLRSTAYCQATRSRIPGSARSQTIRAQATGCTAWR